MPTNMIKVVDNVVNTRQNRNLLFVSPKHAILYQRARITIKFSVVVVVKYIDVKREQ